MLPQELINLLGLARRARKIALGHEAVQEALGRKQAALVILATDFSESAQAHLAEKYPGVPRVHIGTKNEWGEFWGRKEVGVMAVTDRNLAQGILKKTLRTVLRKVRQQIQTDERACAGLLIMQKLMQLEIYQIAQTVHTYVSWQDEVDTQALIHAFLREGRRVAVPKVRRKAHTLAHYFIDDFAMLAPGAFGILEPAEEKGAKPVPGGAAFDLIIVPGLAFDRRGHRRGYGAGYYDRFLSQISAPKIGLAFAAQIVEKIPAAPHDQRVDFVITENEVFECEVQR